MPSVSDFISYLESFAPLSLAEDWDNVGLLVGRRDAAVGRAMTCLTLTPDVAAEAIAKDVQLIVTHHPVLFRGAKTITDGNAEGRMLLDLVEAGVAVYSPHTAFDSANHGINQSLADSFGLCLPSREFQWRIRAVINADTEACVALFNFSNIPSHIRRRRTAAFFGRSRPGFFLFSLGRFDRPRREWWF